MGLQGQSMFKHSDLHLLLPPLVKVGAAASFPVRQIYPLKYNPPLPTLKYMGKLDFSYSAAYAVLRNTIKAP